MATTRREELLDKTVQYLLEHGIGDLSLRPLAAATGTKARLLIYHFGSRDELVAAALSVVLRRVQNAFLSMHCEATLEGTLLGFWRYATDKPNLPYLRLFLEVHGLAVHDPDMYGEYLRASLESWKSLIAERLKKRGASRRQREELATLVIATVDGLFLDFLATGDRERTTRALLLFTRQLKRGIK
jgi:AcrR family transcriptional regulator